MIAILDGAVERTGSLQIGARFQLLQDLVASQSSHQGNLSAALKTAFSSSREISRLRREMNAKKAAGKKG